MSQPALLVEGLEFHYPDGRHALRGVNLNVEVGERVAILGPNGAGKTTFALHLNGLLRAEKGRISVGGLTLGDDTLGVLRRKVGLVFQDPNDQLFMPTVTEDVAFGPANLGIIGADLERRTAETLARVGASDLAARPPHHLSGGEKRLVSIATVLAMDPELIVLDEPGSGLDPAGRREMIRLLAGLDVTLLVITHDLPLALELCPRSVIMDRGTMVVDMPTTELLRSPDMLHRHRLELPYGFELV
ncbi:MAG: energy-coupling factor ABC transporter ATP-binding protein [Actinobacteria bacterium]|nr:energy-coupling factor ABC transporter ATP-binding protein [Actinomycetota bacterium]